MADETPPPMLAPGFLVGGGRFTLLQELARGGMGIVWLAHDERLNAQVALKFLSERVRANATALTDLREETQKCRMLSHPNIIRIYDLYEAPGEDAFISMEYVDGPSLWALRSRQHNGCFPWDYLSPIIRQLCDALHYAHTEGVVHRDLKPSNMLLDERHRLRLADFGLAVKVYETMTAHTERHRFTGTLSYMSPQQLDGIPASVSDDIYGLGATLYEFVTGNPPFYEHNVQHQIRNVVPTPIIERLAELELQNEIPGDVAAMIMACLAKEPAKRPQTAEAIAEWIGFTKDAQGSTIVKPSAPKTPEPLTAKPSSGVVRESNPTRRRFILGFGLVGIALVTWLAWARLPSLKPGAIAATATNVVTTNESLSNSSTIVPILAATGETNGTILFGTEIRESGLHLIDSPDERITAPATMGGKECRLILLPSGDSPRAKIYFSVGPGLKPAEAAHARLRVEYYALADGLLQVQYDGFKDKSVKYKNGGRKEFAGDGVWKMAYFELDNAVFRGGERNGADFCLNTGCRELYIRSVNLLIDN